MAGVLAWLADDLRAGDNLALATALGAGPGAAVVRVRPEARGRPARTVGRRRLEDGAEASLAEGLAKAGVAFESIGPGDDGSIAAACRRHGCTSVVRNGAGGTALERSYRDEAEADLASARIPLRVVNGESNSWSGPGGDPADRPFLRTAGWDADGEGSALADLRSFLAALPGKGYRELMWVPGRDRDATSLLSTAIAAGTLSGDRALHETAMAEAAWHAANPAGAGTPEARSFRSFAARLGWRRGFMDAYEHRHGDRALRVPHDAARMAAWREGRTGVPMVDAAMRELAATGWANFRMRQTVASFGVQTLGLPAAMVGEALAGLFDDYEPAITYLQMGLHSGEVAPSRGPRIVNPVKQGRDLDAEETYVRRWLPELASLPAGFAHEPWRHPDNPIGDPIVDHGAAARSARARWPGSAARAVEAQGSLL